ALAGAVAQRDMRTADGELLIAVEIRETDAQPLAAERRADDEAQGLVLERAFIDRDEPGGPSTDPFLARHYAPLFLLSAIHRRHDPACRDAAPRPNLLPCAHKSASSAPAPPVFSSRISSIASASNR